MRLVNKKTPLSFFTHLSPPSGSSPPPRPPRPGVLLLRQAPRQLCRPPARSLPRPPLAPQALHDRLARQAQVADERLVRAAGAVLRLARRLAQVAADQRQVGGVQDRAVVQQVVALALLGVAAE